MASCLIATANLTGVLRTFCVVVQLHGADCLKDGAAIQAYSCSGGTGKLA